MWIRFIRELSIRIHWSGYPVKSTLPTSKYAPTLFDLKLSIKFRISKGLSKNLFQTFSTAIETQERQNYTLKIIAKTPKISDDIVAEFDLTLSIKDYTNK